MAHRSSSHVIPLPADRVTRLLLTKAEKIAAIDSLVDVGALGISLRTHRDAAFAGKPVREVAGHLLCGLCAPANYTGLDSAEIVDLAEQALTEFAALNDCIFDWKCAVALDELNDLVDEALAGHEPTTWARQWTRTYLLPNDEGQSWDFGDHSPLQNLDLQAVVLVPMTGLTAQERRAYRSLALAICHELEAQGFEVHCPALSPNVGLTDEEIALSDVTAMSKATVVIALVPKPALGVGIGVGITAIGGNRPLFLILGPEGTDVSPLTGVLDKPVLLSAETPDEVRRRLVQFLNNHRSRVNEHARLVQDRRTRYRSRFESFRIAVSLETKLQLPTSQLTDRLKVMLCSNIDVFIAATVLNDEVSEYLLAVERGMSAQPGPDQTSHAASQDTAPSLKPAFPFTPSHLEPQAPTAGDLEAEDEQSTASAANMDWPSMPTVRKVDIDPVYEDVGLPRLGVPDEESEQLALFGVGNPVHPAAPRQNRPAGWKEIALLSTKEIGIGLRAIARVKLEPEEAQKVFDYAAGVRFDQQLLAAAGGGVSYVPLTQIDQWFSMIEDMRCQP